MTFKEALGFTPGAPADRSDETGFTLVEILLALTIFSFGMLSVASMQAASINGNATSANTTDATWQAITRIEELMETDYDDATLNAGTTTETVTPPAIPAITYTITKEVTANDLIDNTKSISITVQWTERGTQRQINVQCVIPRII